MNAMQENKFAGKKKEKVVACKRDLGVFRQKMGCSWANFRSIYLILLQTYFYATSIH